MRTNENLIAEPAARRRALLELIATARRRLQIATFRFSDREVESALGAAVRQGVEVEVMSPRRLRSLSRQGIKVHRYEGPAGSYHARFLVADGEMAAICTFNLTTRGLDRTCDFLLTTGDPSLAAALERIFDADAAGADPLAFLALPEPIVLGPEWARAQLWEWIAGARRSIRLLDPRVSDPGLLRLLSRKKAEGVEVDWLAGAPRRGLAPHGRLLLIDDETLVAGSCSLQPRALDRRREVAMRSRDPRVLATALRFWRSLVSAPPGFFPSPRSKRHEDVRRAA